MERQLTQETLTFLKTMYDNTNAKDAAQRVLTRLLEGEDWKGTSYIHFAKYGLSVTENVDHSIYVDDNQIVFMSKYSSITIDHSDILRIRTGEYTIQIITTNGSTISFQEKGRIKQ